MALSISSIISSTDCVEVIVAVGLPLSSAAAEERGFEAIVFLGELYYETKFEDYQAVTTQRKNHGELQANCVED